MLTGTAVGALVAVGCGVDVGGRGVDVLVGGGRAVAVAEGGMGVGVAGTGVAVAVGAVVAVFAGSGVSVGSEVPVGAGVCVGAGVFCVVAVGAGVGELTVMTTVPWGAVGDGAGVEAGGVSVSSLVGAGTGVPLMERVAVAVGRIGTRVAVRVGDGTWVDVGNFGRNGKVPGAVVGLPKSKPDLELGVADGMGSSTVGTAFGMSVGRTVGCGVAVISSALLTVGDTVPRVFGKLVLLVLNSRRQIAAPVVA
jgi:hypothetical protein